MLRFLITVACLAGLLWTPSCSVVKNNLITDQPSKGDYELIFRIQTTRGGSAQAAISALQSFDDWIFIGHDGDSNLVQVKYRNLTREQWTYLLHQLHSIPDVLIQETRIPHS